MTRFKFKIAAVAALILSMCGPAMPQSGLREAPLGFCTNSSLGSAAGLSSFTGTACSVAANLKLATYGVICAYTAGVVWRDDGTAPTATPGTGGQGIAANQCIPYNGTFTAI